MTIPANRVYTSFGHITGSSVYHYGSTFDRTLAITGVVTSNKPEWLHDDIADGIDLDYDEHIADCEVCADDPDDCSEAPIERGTTLIGGWKLVDGQYTPDTDSEYSAIVGEMYCQVVHSKRTVRRALCSPCFPGQADLDTPGEYLAFDLPLDMYGADDTLDPYFTVVIPWSDSPTSWHPTQKTGPFATLTRGAFATEEQAHEWARAHLSSQPYTLRRFTLADY